MEITSGQRAFSNFESKKSIYQKISDKFLNRNNDNIISDIASNIILKEEWEGLDTKDNNMCFEELLELVSYCMQENPEVLTENQRNNILAFIETLDIAEEEEEWNFLRRSGIYMENGWHHMTFSQSTDYVLEPRENSEKSSNTICESTDLHLRELNRCPYSSPASVELLEEECPQMKEYRNLFENSTSTRLCSDKKLLDPEEHSDSLDLTKCLYLPPKYNIMSRPMAMKYVPCADDNENGSVDFVNTFEFQEWKDDEEYILSQRKPDRLKRSDEKAKIAEQMMSYVHAIENHRNTERVPEVFQRFWDETNVALGIDSNSMLNGLETEARGIMTNSADEEDDLLWLGLDRLDNDNNSLVVSAANHSTERETDESLSFSAWNIETSSDDMATFPLRQRQHEDPITDTSEDDDDFMDFYMGRSRTTNTDTPHFGGRDGRGIRRSSSHSHFPEFTERWNSNPSQPLTRTNPLLEEEIPVPFISYTMGTAAEVGMSNGSSGLSQTLIKSIEEYVDESENDSDDSREEDNESPVEDQFEMEDINEYFSPSRIFKMPDGQIPPQVEVDEENFQIEHKKTE